MIDQADVLGRRIAAGLIDLLALVIILIVVGIAFGRGSTTGSSASVHLSGTSALVFVALAIAYYWILEATTGQTPGKRLLAIRVCRVDGSRLGARAAGIRTLLRLVDALPALYLLGFVVILASGPTRRQRLGDIAAKSAVVPA